MKKSKKGFTLIELVVVIAVLAILAAIAVPVVSGVIGDARTNVDLANAKTIESAVKLYVADQNITTVDASAAELALDAVNLGNIQTQANTGNSFIINPSTFAVTIGASTGATVVDATKYPDIFVGA